jgi:ABC-type amino acid transport substrate-binding protein/heat shock protein HslJ
LVLKGIAMTTSPLPQQPPVEQPKKKSRGLLYGILAALILLLLIVAGVRACQSLAPQPTPPPASNGDTSWTTVKQSGVWIVGTSSGYPPFEYYTESRNLDGFDIALTYEIAKKLGVQVNIQDFAFDGLPNALQIGQIDSAIAAISVTSQRQSVLRFSNVYYVGSDGILALKGSAITSVKTIQDMANKRVGVEQNTVYQTWVQNNLVNTGLISSSQMFVYAQAKDAVNDLSLGRLDLVMMDLQPAIASTNFYGVVLVGQGLDPQKMAIASNLNANELTVKINQALVELQNEGVVAVLEKQYLNLDPADALPVPTPIPTPVPAAPTPTFIPTPTAATGCIDSMAYVSDLTYNDNNLNEYPDLKPGEAFSKGWRIRNTGTCTWDSKYYVNFVSGTQMGGQPTAIQGQVTPGATYDLYINLIAPNSPGRYEGIWQMYNPQNLAFGERLWVAIEVIGPTSSPTTKPQATTTPPVSTSLPATATKPAQATATNPPAATATLPPSTATQKPPTPTTNPAAGLVGPNWVVISLHGATPASGVQQTAIFNASGVISGKGGCNNYSGSYVTSGNVMAISNLVGGQMMCDAAVMTDEQNFFQALGSTQNFQVVSNGAELDLLSGGVVVVQFMAQ